MTCWVSQSEAWFLLGNGWKILFSISDKRWLQHKILRKQQFDSEHPVLFPVLDPRCDKCTNSCDFLLGPKNEMWFKQKSKTCQKFQNCVISFRTWWKKLASCPTPYIHTQIILTFFAHFVELLLLSMTFRIFCKQRKQNP